MHYVRMFAEALRGSSNLIARELKKLANLRQLNTVAYAQTVNQKKQDSRAAKRKAAEDPVSLADKLIAEQLAHKKSNRAHRRKLSKLGSQIKKLRQDKRALKAENRRLKAAIACLKQGKHDIQLEGEVQNDVEHLFKECRKATVLQETMAKQDDANGTLKAFWQEQVERSLCENKRKKWNPVVLRFMLHLWEKMGEKNFRVLGDEKVRQ